MEKTLWILDGKDSTVLVYIEKRIVQITTKYKILSENLILNKNQNKLEINIKQTIYIIMLIVFKYLEWENIELTWIMCSVPFEISIIFFILVKCYTIKS